MHQNPVDSPQVAETLKGGLTPQQGCIYRLLRPAFGGGWAHFFVSSSWKRSWLCLGHRLSWGAWRPGPRGEALGQDGRDRPPYGGLVAQVLPSPAGSPPAHGRGGPCEQQCCVPGARARAAASWTGGAGGPLTGPLLTRDELEGPAGHPAPSRAPPSVTRDSTGLQVPWSPGVSCLWCGAWGQERSDPARGEGPGDCGGDGDGAQRPSQGLPRAADAAGAASPGPLWQVGAGLLAAGAATVHGISRLGSDWRRAPWGAGNKTWRGGAPRQGSAWFSGVSGLGCSDAG